MCERAVIVEEIGMPVREIIIEIDQKRELALLVVTARKGAVEVGIEGLSDIYR